MNSKANEPIHWTRSGKDGIPSFQGLRECLLLGKNNVIVLRLILTIFRQYDRIILPTDVKIDKIIDKSPISDEFNLVEFNSFCNQIRKNLFPEELNFTESSLLASHTPRYKKGPNGSCLMTARYDAFAIYYNSKLADSIKN